MNFLKSLILLFFASSIVAFNWNCKSLSNAGSAFGNALLPDVSADAKLGKQTSDEIAKDPTTYPLLPERGNEEVYAYVRGIKNKLLATGKVEHAADFPWEVKIINDPKTLNAFCTPGGYIYVYTGIMKYLDSEDQLAGVMGHEMGHAAKRHSMKQMYEQNGVMLAEYIAAYILVGKKDSSVQNTANTIGQITAGLIGLKFSRAHEKEADEMSVNYLCGTEYNAAGAAGFFKKITASGAASQPEFLSTHPSPPNRVESITANAKASGCTGSAKNTAQYQHIKSLLR